MITDEELRRIEERALAIRKTLITMLAEAGSGHTEGPLGMADIYAALYMHVLRHDPANPDWPERDRLVLSNGHTAPVRYAAMAHAGYFPLEECMTLRKFGSRLQGHPERHALPGVETTSGPLGSGLSQAVGMALAARIDGHSHRIFCLTSDGEHDEGNTWEAVLLAAKYRLSNLISVMDRNNIQIDGTTDDVMPLEPVAEKYRAFNWHVIDGFEGHDIRAFVAACDEARTVTDKPVLILPRVTPGKGIPEIENDYRWHGKPPTKDEAARFISKLDESAVHTAMPPASVTV